MLIRKIISGMRNGVIMALSMHFGYFSDKVYSEVIFRRAYVLVAHIIPYY